MKQQVNHIFILFILFFLSTTCNENPYKQGEILYNNFCSSCHMEDGSGLGLEIPPLANADYLKQYNLEVACIIRYGQQDTIQVNGKTYSQPMAGIKKLTDVEITNIINYINQAWGNDYGTIQLPKVREKLNECK